MSTEKWPLTMLGHPILCLNGRFLCRQSDQMMMRCQVFEVVTSSPGSVCNGVHHCFTHPRSSIHVMFASFFLLFASLHIHMLPLLYFASGTLSAIILLRINQHIVLLCWVLRARQVDDIVAHVIAAPDPMLQGDERYQHQRCEQHCSRAL